MENKVLEVLLNRIVDILLIIVGLSGFFIYYFQKNDQKRTAATLIKNQIDSIESVVKDLRDKGSLDNITVYKSKVILNRNYWEEYKYLLSKKMGSNDIKLIEDFYEKAERIEKSRESICSELTTAWVHKDQILQEKFYYSAKERIENKDNSVEENVITKYNESNRMFMPQLPIDLLSQSVLNFRFLSGTTAYEKLNKWSYDK